MAVKSVPDNFGYFSRQPYVPNTPPEAATAHKAAAGADAAEAGPLDRDHGLNMKATVGRVGKGNDATFHKFASVHIGDPYIDPLKVQLQADAERRKGQLVERPFRAASPMKVSTTPGDFYGTSGVVPYIPTHLEVQRKKGDFPTPPKGIYTSPAKKGSFGVNKTTLSERTGHKGVATEYEYQHDPETLQLEARRAAQKADRGARVTELPFKPSHPARKGGFGVPNTTLSKGKGVAGEYEYVIPPPQDVPKDVPRDGAPFKPSYAYASDHVAPIPYYHDPEEPKLKAESTKKLAESARLASTGAWKPNQSYKTDSVRSIVRMNIR